MDGISEGIDGLRFMKSISDPPPQQAIAILRLQKIRILTLTGGVPIVI